MKPAWVCAIVSECGELPDAATAASVSDDFARPKSRDLDLPVRGDLDIGRLEVTVHDAAFVRLFERPGDLPRHRECLVERHRAAREPHGEILTPDQFHREQVDGRTIGEPGALETIDLRNVGVIQGGEQPRFAFQTRDPLRIGAERCRQDLDGDLPHQPRIDGAVDLAHTTRAKRGGDLKRADARARLHTHLFGGATISLAPSLTADSAHRKSRTASEHAAS